MTGVEQLVYHMLGHEADQLLLYDLTIGVLVANSGQLGDPVDCEHVVSLVSYVGHLGNLRLRPPLAARLAHVRARVSIPSQLGGRGGLRIVVNSSLAHRCPQI